MKKFNLKLFLGLMSGLLLSSIALSCSPNTNNQTAQKRQQEEPKNDASNHVEQPSVPNKQQGNNDQPSTPTVDNEKESSNKYVYDLSDNYYEALNGKKGSELLEAIINLQSSKRSFIKEYKDLPGFYNNSNAFKDTIYENDNTILDFYSENPNGEDPYNFAVYATEGGANEGDGTNREHIIPQSWFGKQNPIRNDAQFVWPTDIKVNQIRGNYPHADVVTVTKTTKNNSKLGNDANGNTVFEVIDEFKGDIARAYLYFLSHYGKDKVGSKNSIFTPKKYPYMKQGFLDTYIKWHKKDTVSKWDVIRNNETYKFQKIRNPFIDYPGLVDNIFGNDPKPFQNKGILVEVN
ncbi:endonuclease [Mycoplasmopsis edwardii]|nr:endonuclease [Mycoplasmopsis edwardii]